MRTAIACVATLCSLLSVGCGPRMEELIEDIIGRQHPCHEDPGDPEPDEAYQVLDGGYVLSGDWAGYAWVATDEASNASPEDFVELDAGQPLCFNGFVHAAEDYSGFAGLGINLNQGIDSDAPGSWDVSSAGIHYQLTNSLQSELRLELLGTDGEIWCAALQTDSGSLAWSEFRTECWSNQGDVYDGSTPLQSIMVLVPGQNVSDTAFDLCIETSSPPMMFPARLRSARTPRVPVRGLSLPDSRWRRVVMSRRRTSTAGPSCLPPPTVATGPRSRHRISPLTPVRRPSALAESSAHRRTTRMLRCWG